MLIANKIKFDSKAVTRDKEDHYIMIKVYTHQENITIISRYALNVGAFQIY